MIATTKAHEPRSRGQRNRVLDLRGEINPEPVLILAAAATSLKDGGYLSVITDDLCSPNDFLCWSDGNDTHLLDIYYIHGGAAVAVFCKGGWDKLVERAGESPA